ncbi:MAG: conjugative transposon TraM protein, partial [bacterium F082]
MTEEKKTAASQSEARPLTEQERQRRKKMIVYPLMVLIFLGSMWLIFAPTGDKEVKGGDGFNTEMPDAAAGGIIGDKAKAYETTGRQEERRQEREMAIGDLGTLFARTAPAEREAASDTTGTTGNGDFSLTAPEDGTPSDRKVKSTRQTIASSAEAYRDINRTLGSFYQPSEDAANEQLKSRISELEDKLASQAQTGTNTVDEQMALMERSYQLAAKYM